MFQEISVSTKRSQYASRGLRGFPSSFWGAPGDLSSTPECLRVFTGSQRCSGTTWMSQTHFRKSQGSHRDLWAFHGVSEAF